MYHSNPHRAMFQRELDNRFVGSSLMGGTVSTSRTKPYVKPVAPPPREGYTSVDRGVRIKEAMARHGWSQEKATRAVDAAIRGADRAKARKAYVSDKVLAARNHLLQTQKARYTQDELSDLRKKYRNEWLLANPGNHSNITLTPAQKAKLEANPEYAALRKAFGDLARKMNALRMSVVREESKSN